MKVFSCFGPEKHLHLSQSLWLGFLPAFLPPYLFITDSIADTLLESEEREIKVLINAFEAPAI